MEAALGWHLFMPNQMIRSMIGQIDHDGVFLKFGRFEPIKNSSDMIVIDSNGVTMLSHNFTV